MITPNTAYVIPFETTVAGVPTAADATPTAVLWRNGSAEVTSVVIVTTANTGIYHASFTTDAGWAATDRIWLVVSATIDGDAYTAVAWDSFAESDSAATIAAAVKVNTDQVVLLNLMTTTQNISALPNAIWSVAFSGFTAATGTFGYVVASLSTMIEFIGGFWRFRSTAVKVVTDEVGVVGDAVAALPSAAVAVLPAVGISADRSPGVVLSPFVGETITQSITLYQTDGTTPIVLTGKSLEIVFETRQGSDVAVISNASIVISGDSDNVVTFSYPSAVTLSERVLRFSLRDDAAPRAVYLTGICKVGIAPGNDPA